MVIIGGVALGPKVACRIKRLDPTADVVVVDKDEELPAMRVPLRDRMREAQLRRLKLDEGRPREAQSRRRRAGGDEEVTRDVEPLDDGRLTEAFEAMLRVALAGDQRDQLSSLPQPIAEAGVPVVIVPTTRAVRAATSKLMQTGMESAKLSLAARIAAGPILAWARERVSDVLVETHVLAMMRLGRDSVDEAGRAALDRYFKEREDAAVDMAPPMGRNPAEEPRRDRSA